MKEIQQYLTIDERVEIYNSGIILYNLESTYMTFASEELRHYFSHALSLL